MLKEIDFKWKIRRANNIPENPIECEFCLVDYGNGKGKLYKVKPLYAQNTDGLSDVKGGYRYFVFFDCSVRLATEEDREREFFSFCEYAGYVITSESFISVFDTMEDAKKRAYTQYRHHFGYVLPHVVDDIEKETRNHFVIQ